MKRLNVTCICSCIYNSSIEVPDNLSFEEAIEYAKKHINEIPLGNLNYITDSDELDEDNCEFEEEITEEFSEMEKPTLEKQIQEAIAKTSISSSTIDDVIKNPER